VSDVAPETLSEAQQGSANGAPEPSWELESQLAELESLKPDDVVGMSRMGAGLAFINAGSQLADVIRILKEVRLDWDRIGPTKRGEIVGQVNAFTQSVTATLRMDSSSVDTTEDTGMSWTPDEVRNQRDGYEAAITQAHAWLTDNVPQLCVVAPARRAAQEWVEAETASLSEEQVQALRNTFADLRNTATEFERLRPVVEAQRELLGASGTTKLSSDFDAESTGHGRAWKWWLGGLLAWVAVAGVGGVAFIDHTKPPNDATNAQIASHLFLDLLVIGLALFVVRILALQFRAHRHLEVVARNKASALTTFNRLVQGQDPEVKAVVAAALAQAVFTTEDSIFSDSSGEHVTILERVIAPSLDRVRPG
jgi:hypothetical protein